MDLRIIELQRQLPDNEANTFAYKFERRKKSVTTAVLLPFFLGGFGVHRFWFNEIGIGLIYLVFCELFWQYSLLGNTYLRCFLHLRQNFYKNNLEIHYLKS